MIGIYNYTVILTYIGAVMGFIGMTAAFNGNMKGALYCLIAAGLCDMFDGKIASTMERTQSQKRFGVQIDSLSDLVCFGVLPALIIYTGCGGGTLSLAASALYTLCALIRLAWFNVDEEKRQDQESCCRSVFCGLPVTTSALVIPSVMALGVIFRLPMNIIAPVVLILMGAAFLTPFRMKKPALPGKIAMLLCGIAEIILLFKAGWGI